MDRMSTKKFKFQHSSTLALQCIVQLSWKKPAGVCGGDSASWGMNPGNASENTPETWNTEAPTRLLSVQATFDSEGMQIGEEMRDYGGGRGGVEDHSMTTSSGVLTQSDESAKEDVVSRVLLAPLQKLASEVARVGSNWMGAAVSHFQQKPAEETGAQLLRRVLKEGRGLQQTFDPQIGPDFTNAVMLQMADGNYDGSMIITEKNFADPEWVTASGALSYAEGQRRYGDADRTRPSGARAKPAGQTGPLPVWVANSDVAQVGTQAAVGLGRDKLVIPSVTPTHPPSNRPGQPITHVPPPHSLYCT